MNQIKFPFFDKNIYLFFLSILVFSFQLIGQNNTKVSDSTQVVKNTISIGSISEETEKLSQRITKLRVILNPSTKISEIDSLLNVVSVEIKNKKDSLSVVMDKLNRRTLKVIKIEWETYNSYVNGYQKILKSRTEDLSDIDEEIVLELKRWEQTKEILDNSNDNKDVTSSLDLAINTLSETLQLAHERLNRIFVIQKRLTDLVLTIDDVISEIELMETKLQKDYFVFDSKPIWKSNISNFQPKDSTEIHESTSSNRIFIGLKENRDQIIEFLSLHTKIAIFQFLFILLLFVLMIVVNKKWRKNINELSNPIEIQAKIVLSSPIASALVTGILISAFFFDALVPAFAELLVFLILIGTIVLLPKLTNPRFNLFLIMVFVVYLDQIFEMYLNPLSTTVRVLMILDAVLLIIAIINGRKLIKRSPESFVQIYRIYQILAPIYLLLLLVAVFVNVIGMVGLSRFLINGVLLSIALGMVVYLAVKVISSLIILMFKLRKPNSIKALTTVVELTHRRIQPVLNWFGILIWLMFTLKGFDVFDLMMTWIDELMLVKWHIGEMVISVGGILAFFGIFILTLVLAKLAASIFLDEWMIQVLPRGVAPAISLVMRIFLVGIGLYMAFSAAGLDLSRLGFIIGALGVGIGFGLQSVVLNFIAGLILAFERPINLGDTIEVDQEFGVVTSIGVRSSTIRTYSGFEAIIPNGDLISKKVLNYTLHNRDRRSKIIMKTAPSADPEKVIQLFNSIADKHPNTFKDPAPITFFYGYGEDGSLDFTLFYWTTFSETLETDHEIALEIFTKLKENSIQAHIPIRRIIK